MKEAAKWCSLGMALLLGSLVVLTSLPDTWVANYAFRFFGSPPNTEEGSHWLELAATGGNKEAQNLIVKINKDAQDLIAIGLLQNSPVGKNLPPGNSAEENSKVYQAIELLKASDTPEAQLNLAICYFFGYGNPHEQNPRLLEKSKKLLEESPLPKAKELYKQLGMPEDSPSSNRGLYFYMLGYQHVLEATQEVEAARKAGIANWANWQSPNIIEAGNMFLKSTQYGIPEGAANALYLWKGRPLTTKINIDAIVSLARQGNVHAIELTQQLLVTQLAQLYLPILKELQPYLPAKTQAAYLQVIPELSNLAAKCNITFSASPTETLQHIKTGLQQQTATPRNHTIAIEKSIALLNELAVSDKTTPPPAQLDTQTAQMLNQALDNFKQAGGVLPISNEVSSIIQRLLEGIATDQGERTFLSSDPPHTIEVNNEYYDLCYANERFFYLKYEPRQVPLDAVESALELWNPLRDQQLISSGKQPESLWANFDRSRDMALPATYQVIPLPHGVNIAELWNKGEQSPSAMPQASYFWKIIFAKNATPRAGLLTLAGLGFLLFAYQNYRKSIKQLVAKAASFLKWGVPKNLQRSSSEWKLVIQTAKKDEMEKQYLEVLGLPEVTELAQVYPAFRKQSQGVSRKARKSMTPEKRKEAAEKMKMLEEAKAYFELKYPRIWQAPTGKHKRYRHKH